MDVFPKDTASASHLLIKRRSGRFFVAPAQRQACVAHRSCRLARWSDFLIAKIQPVLPKQLDRMLGAIRTVSALQGVDRTILVTAPANPLRMLGMGWKFFCHFIDIIEFIDGNRTTLAVLYL